MNSRSYALFGLFVWITISIQLKSLAQTIKAHPYLYYTNERIDKLREKIKTDSILASGVSKITSYCEQWISASKGGDMEQFAFMYCFTGDKKYADKAKQLLTDIVNKNAWDGMDDRTPRWNSALSTAHYNRMAAVTYDAIYKSLTNEERISIANKIFKLGIEPSLADWLSKEKRIHSLNSMGHNWWASIVFQAGVASLAVMNDIPEAKRWASEILDASKEWIGFSGSVLENKPATYDPEGGFYESVSYANFGVSEYLLFRLAWTNAFSAITMPYDNLLKETGDWFINASYPKTEGQLMSLNFGDSNDFANGDRVIKLLTALGLRKDEYDWYLKYTARNDFKEDLNASTPMGLLYNPEKKLKTESISLPLSTIYSNMGWGMLRNSWKPDATFLGVKSGFTWNHAHADAGSFVLYHNGENLLIDGGDVNYARPEYSGYFVTSRAHNVMMFNGVAQDPQDEYYAVKNPGHLYNLIDGGNVKYILADATGPTSRNFLRNYRNFLWIGDVILIIDDVKSYDIGQFDFLLHYADTATKIGPDFEITRKKSSILFRPLYPEGLPLGYPHDLPEKLKFRTEYGIKDRTFDVKIPYYVLSAPEKKDREKFVNAIILLNDSNKAASIFTGSSGSNATAGRTNLPKIEKFQGNNFIGIRITQNSIVTEVYVNLLADGRLMHRNANNIMEGWETDAYISAISFPEGSDKNDLNSIYSLFVSNGSYFRKENKVMLSSLSKVFMYAEKDGNSLNVQLQGQPIMNVSLLNNRINKLTVNNKPSIVKLGEDKLLLIELNANK
jgi:hypothetical protein